MKKLFIFLFTLGSISSLSAQHSRNNNQYDPNPNRSSKEMVSNSHNRTHGRETCYSAKAHSRDDRYNDRNRRWKMETINRDYDKKIQDYRGNRYLNTRERERRILQA